MASSTKLLRAGIVAVSVSATCATALVMAPPSYAGACSETGGENNRLMWTGKGYTCAYVADTGNNSIGFARTETWTSNTALGYSKRYTCHGQSGGVAVDYVYTDSAGTNLGSSITYTAVNTSSGDRHWNAAVLWNTAKKAGSVADNQFIHNCSTDKSIGVQQFYESKLTLAGPTEFRLGTPANFKATVKHPDGGPAPSGLVYLFTESKPGVKNPRTKDCAGNSSNTKTPVDVPVAQGYVQMDGVATLNPLVMPTGTFQFYAVYAGYPVTSNGLAGYCNTPPQATGLTPSISGSVTTTVRPQSPPGPTSQSVTQGIVEGATTPQSISPRGDVGWSAAQLAVVNRRAVAPARAIARCRPGMAPVQVSLRSPTAVLNSDSAGLVNRGASASTSALPAGTVVELQLVCRSRQAAALVLPGISWGSVRPDSLVTNRKGGAVFGGYGADTLRVVRRFSGAWGGPSRDKISVRAGEGSAAGGHGADRLISSAAGPSLLVGGSGPDILIGANGATVINAQDGRGGDVIRCRSPKNRVYLDPGDRTRGPCTVVGG